MCDYTRRWTAILGLSLCGATAAGAQATSVSLDATLGAAHGQTNGIYLERRKQSLSGDVAFATSLHPESSRGLFVGANASFHSAGGTAVCEPGPGGECTEPFPSFSIVGLLIGWESARSVLRIASGIAYAKSEYSTGSLAFQTRIDAAAPISRHVALVGSLRGTHVPNVDGDRFTLFGLGAGIRVY